MREHSSIIFKLEGANPSGEHIKRQLESVLKKIIKTVHKSISCKIQIAKPNFFMKQESGNIGNIYNFFYKKVISKKSNTQALIRDGLLSLNGKIK